MTTYIIKVEDISVHALHVLQQDMLNYMSQHMSHNTHVVALLSLKPTISFGGNKKRNSFRKSIEDALGDEIRTPNGNLTESVQSKLKFLGIDDCAFIESNRGGGSTYLGPGQRTVFFNYNLHHRFGNGNDDLELDRHIEQIMHGTVESQLKPWLEKTNVELYAHPQKDLIGNYGGELKFASKGWAATQFHGKKYSRFGCSFHVQEKGLAGFDKVLPCGFKDLRPVSYEELLGRPISMEEFDSHLFVELAKHEKVILPDDRLNVMQKNVDVYLQNPAVANLYRS